MEPRYETELVKNCLIPISDGVTLAADLYRPLTDETVPALISFTPYHKDGWYASAYEELMRGMAQVGYGCLAVDVRGTGNSGGSTTLARGEREALDHYETVEWAAGQQWCDGKVGVWGKSYGAAAALMAASRNPPHLGAVAVFHGAPSPGGILSTGGRLRFLETLAQYGPRMANWNYMPPGYRDLAGRWMSVWRQHLESNVPWLISALDLASSGEPQYEPLRVTMERIRVPVYLWAGWRDVAPQDMIEAYRSLKVPKKLTAGPWMHVLPDAGHAGRVDYLNELQRWFDYWLKGEDTGIMEEPPVSLWVQEEEAWFCEDDFPPPEVETREMYLGREGTLSANAPAPDEGGVLSFEYDATAGIYADVRSPRALDLDQRLEEFKGLTYTTPPLGEDIEICGVPQVLIHYRSTVPETLLAVRLCDVWPNGKPLLITEGWLDTNWAASHPSTQGEVFEAEWRASLNLVPTCYLLRTGHRLRLFVSGSHFPRVLPSGGSGEISIAWGKEGLSSVRLPVRPPRCGVRKPAFGTPREIPHPPTKAPSWQIEQSPVDGTTTVRTGMLESLGIDGGEGGATLTYAHECSATVGARQPGPCSAHAESWGCWENEHERVEVQTVSVYRRVGMDLSVCILLNGAPYWQKSWSRSWPQEEQTT